MGIKHQEFKANVQEIFKQDLTDLDLAYVGAATMTPEQAERYRTTTLGRHKLGATKAAMVSKSMDYLKANAQVKQSKKSESNNDFPAQGVTTNMSASKRKTRSGMWGSALRSKNQAALKLEATREDLAEQNLQSEEAFWRAIDAENPETVERIRPNMLHAVAHYAKEESEEKKRELARKLGGSKEDINEVIHACVTKFMAMDFGGIDVSSDAAFAASAATMERISKSIKDLDLILHLDGRSGAYYKKTIPDEAQKLLNEKMELAKHISGYYDAQKQVLEDPYYRTHYNSEISKYYNPEDAPERRLLAMKIEMASEAYALLTGKKRVVDTTKNPLVSPEQLTEYQRILPMAASETGKNGGFSRENVHIELVNQMFADGDTVQRLQKEKYRVTGDTRCMDESLFRNLSNVAQSKYVQSLPTATIEGMVEKLKKKPANPEDPESVQEARTQNIEGMRMYKEMIHRQIDYLDRKYGAAILAMTPQEIAAHHAEFDADFSNLQGTVAFLEYTETFPELRTELDRQMRNRALFYSMSVFGEANGRNAFITGNSFELYTNYRVSGIQEVYEAVDGMESLLNEHAEVRWGTMINEANPTMESCISFYTDKATLSAAIQKFRDDGVEGPLNWYRLVPGLRQFTNDKDAISHLMNHILETDREAFRSSYKGKGLPRTAGVLAGLGSDDSETLNNLMLRLRKEPEKLAERGLSQEAIDQYLEYMEQFDEVGFELVFCGEASKRMAEFQNALPLGLYDKDSSEGLLLSDFRSSIELLKKQNYEEDLRLNKEVLEPLGEAFNRFRVENNLFLTDGYDAIFTEKVLPEIAETQAPDVPLQLGDLNLVTHAPIQGLEYLDLSGMMKNKTLKEGADPETIQRTVDKYNEHLAFLAHFAPEMRELVSKPDEVLSHDFWKKYVTEGKGFFANEMYNQFMVRMDILMELQQSLRASLK